MTIRSDFAALILTHGRPDRVHTVAKLREHGYTGRIVIVIDNEDAKADEYRERFEEVVVFDKRAVAARIDEGDNFEDRRAIIYARNASFRIARDLGLRYFIQLDDDYIDFRHKRLRDGVTYLSRRAITDLDAVLSALLDYFEKTPRLLTLAMAQGGDFMGAEFGSAWVKPKRKAMNTFICAVDRPFEFVGRVNEDVNTYVSHGARGGLFLTTMHVAIQQLASQANAGGMTEMYLDSGTYVKSFYSVMYAPSCVRIRAMGSQYTRVHHSVHWRRAVPVILAERWRKQPEKET